MIERLLPAGVASAAMAVDDPAGLLFCEEAAQVARAVPSRRLEFTTGRMCARAALRKLGLPGVPIPSGAHREPLWPRGIVGSITHCAGYRAAALARTVDMLAIGIDAEPHEALPAGVLERVALPEERSWLAAAPARLHWDRLLFSAKESVFKAWFTLTGRSLRFADAILTFEPGDASFRARLQATPSAGGAHEASDLDGRFMVREGLVLTAIVVPNLSANLAVAPEITKSWPAAAGRRWARAAQIVEPAGRSGSHVSSTGRRYRPPGSAARVQP